MLHITSDLRWQNFNFKIVYSNSYTISFLYNKGRSNCTWSSCQEGCTKTVFSCWQIEVEYYHEATDRLQRGRLFTNVKVSWNTLHNIGHIYIRNIDYAIRIILIFTMNYDILIVGMWIPSKCRLPKVLYWLWGSWKELHMPPISSGPTYGCGWSKPGSSSENSCLFIRNSYTLFSLFFDIHHLRLQMYLWRA